MIGPWYTATSRSALQPHGSRAAFRQRLPRKPDDRECTPTIGNRPSLAALSNIRPQSLDFLRRGNPNNPTLKRFAMTLRISLLVASVAIGLAVAPAAYAESIAFKAELKGSEEVPPNDSAGIGTVDATFDTESKALDR